jgi:hypothetical protein
MNREINVGDIWRRRCELHDDFDVVRVVGLVSHAGFHPDEFTIQSATAEFGPTLGTNADGILQHCTLVRRLTKCGRGCCSAVKSSTVAT